MVDERLKTLAKNLVNYSCALKPGEKILIEVFDCGPEIAEEMVKAAYAAGGLPFLATYNSKAEREWLMQATKEQMEHRAKWDVARMADMDAYVSFRGSANTSEGADIPDAQNAAYQSIYGKAVHLNTRLKKKWCVLRYPNEAMAQLAGMSTRAFEDFYFDVCNLNYAKMSNAMGALVERLGRTDQVRILAPGTDLSFSIKGMGAIKCAGNMNVPDGEVYTAPIRDSVNGTISYNTPSLYQGFKFENVSFTFENGKIVAAQANNQEKLKAILDTDEGARYVGEFAIGVNPHIHVPMCDTLFDEKIAGSIHFTPGSAYQDCFNGNVSAVHWDLVLIQTNAWGGGELYFDGELVRKDGVFVTPELECLNPENLI